MFPYLLVIHSPDCYTHVGKYFIMYVRYMIRLYTLKFSIQNDSYPTFAQGEDLKFLKTPNILRIVFPQLLVIYLPHKHTHAGKYLIIYTRCRICLYAWNFSKQNDNYPTFVQEKDLKCLKTPKNFQNYVFIVNCN